jgi:hypothetical protein
MTSAPVQLLRLNDAGDAKPAWITLLTTEHYNLQTQRAATIGEANGRASIFLGALSAGLIALGFQGAAAGGSAATTIFEALVLSSLAFLGTVTFVRCLEISIDDWQFGLRITALRAAYAQLVPEIADLLLTATGAEQAIAMLTVRRQRFQLLLSVAGSIGVITSIVAGSDIGVLTHGAGAPLGAALSAGTITALLAIWASVRFQRARWKGATATEPLS